MIKKVLTALSLATVVGVPAIHAATRTQAPSPPDAATQSTDTIICPLTGEEISPCCCPLDDRTASSRG